MAELKERLERLAEREPPRGAASVWREAQDRLVRRTEVPAVARRRWAPAVVAGLVVALVVAGVAAVVVGRSQHALNVSIAPTPAADELVLVDNATGPLTVVDLKAGGVRAVSLPDKAGGDWNYAIVATGGYFVYQGSNGIMAVPVTDARPALLLGHATEFVPSSRSGYVWLITLPKTDAASVTVQEVRVDGRGGGPRRQFQLAVAPTAAVDRGLVFSDRVWYPATDAVRYLPYIDAEAPNAFDAHGSLVAWGVNCAPSPLNGCASLEVYNLANHTQRSYPAPAGTTGWITTAGEGSHGAFAPNRRQLAMRAVQTSADQTSWLYVLDLATAKTTVVPHSLARTFSPVAWTTTQAVLFESDAHHLGEFRPSSAASRMFSVPCCAVLAPTD